MTTHLSGINQYPCVFSGQWSHFMCVIYIITYTPAIFDINFIIHDVKQIFLLFSSFFVSKTKLTIAKHKKIIYRSIP